MNSAPTSSHYPFDNAAPQARDRFVNLSALYDKVTCRHLDRLGIGVDALPETAFDLIHARAVLTFVPERGAALQRMIAALKPGGWLLIEEMLPPITEAWDRPGHPDVALARKARLAILELIHRGGGDLTFAQRLPGYLGASGLTDFDAEGYFVPYRSDAVLGLAKANIEQLAGAVLDAGLMDLAELDRYRAVLARPDCFYPASMALISVWGRRHLE